LTLISHNKKSINSNIPYSVKIPFHKPFITEDEISEVLESLQSGWLTTGSKCVEFEKAFAEYIGCKYAVAVNSCTAALHIALETIGLQEGDGVITTPMTFAATAEVIRYFNAKPVFIDIEPDTMNIDASKLEEKVKSLKGEGTRLKAIIPVHFAGRPCDMDPIMAIANKYNLKVIEDAAHVLPATYKGRAIGTIGDITCFSFYATKNITTGEGGMAVTDNSEWAERMRIMSLHGISKDAWKRYTAEGNWYYEIIAPGYKYNMTDIAAALGIAQLRKADKFWQRRTEIAMMYNEAFSNVEAIQTPITYHLSPKTSHLTPQTDHSWHLYVLKLNLAQLSIDRNQFIEELKNRGIGVSVHFIPLHIHPYYRDTYGYKPEDFPVAYETYQRIISLPIYPKMTDEEVGRVIEAVKEVVSKNRRLGDRS
jgi:dTDP-4-amino-4,6-dideoxygalactose transaminase